MDHDPRRRRVPRPPRRPTTAAGGQRHERHDRHRPTRRRAAPRAGHARPRGRASEWIKLVSLRSSWITFAAAVVAMVGLGVLISSVPTAHWSQMRPEERLDFDPVDRSLGGVNLAQLAIGVLGVLVVTGEYSTGMIRSSLWRCPRRLPVLSAKARRVRRRDLRARCWSSAFVAFLLGQQVLGTARRRTLGAPHALRAVHRRGAVPDGGRAARRRPRLHRAQHRRRHRDAVRPAARAARPRPAAARQRGSRTSLPYLPSNAGAGVYSVHTDPGMLSTWTGFAVFCAWAAAALLIGALLLQRRDADA